MNNFSKFLTRFAITLMLAFGLQGCETIQTQKYDQSYQIQSSTLDVMSVGVGPRWASNERLIETLRFNGIEARVIPHNQTKGESFSDFVARIQGTSPILAFAFKSTTFRGPDVSSVIEARLYPAGKQVPAWEAVISIDSRSSNDDIILRSIDELGRLRLLNVNQQPAQTPDGKRSYSKCRAVLHPVTSVPMPPVCTQILK